MWFFPLSAIRRKMFRRSRAGWLIIIGLLVAALAGCTMISPSRREPLPENHSGWPQDRSDLTADAELVFGRLENGVRYIIKENSTPRDRVSMHLYVQTGSLNERRSERGVAHFLEHMLFNGSTHFPPGEMVKYFQRIGMQFGPDANAHTGFIQTVYDIILPRGDEKSLGEGLLVLRDYADGAMLLPEEVMREKKVILAEKRSRDSASFRTLKTAFAFEMPGLLVSERFPIGLESTIRQADAKMLRGYYNAWYRPERMILVLVGDLDVDTATRLIQDRFGSLRAGAPTREPPDFGFMKHEGVGSFYHHEAEAGATTVSLEHIVVERQPRDSAAQRRKALLEDLANHMVQKRLERIVQLPKTVLTDARIASGDYLGRLRYAEIRADCKPGDWSAAIAEIEQVLRRARMYGFTPAELQRAKDEYRALLEKAVKEAGTRDSKDLAGEVTHSLNNWRVLLSPRQELDLLAPALEKISLDQVQDAFAKAWMEDHRLVLVTGNAVLNEDKKIAEGNIVAAYRNSLLTSVTPLAEKTVARFPYLPPPADTGSIVRRQFFDDLGIERVDFANGVVLHLKRTEFKANEILVTLSFGQGRAAEPAGQPGLAMMTETVVNESGLDGIDLLQLQEALAGKVARARLQVREDMFLIDGETIPEELPLLFQLLYAQVRDPGYRPEIRALALKRWEQEYQAMERSTDGLLRLKVDSFFAGNDPRLGMAPWEQLQLRTLAQVRQWYGRQLRQGPVSIAVVGDFEPDTVIELARRYFGAMPEAQGRPVAVRPIPGFPSGEKLRLTVDTDIPKALVVVAYPTEDFWKIRRTRRLAIMAELLSERLRERIREKLGAAYSPYAYNRSHRAYAGYGTTQVHVLVDPRQAEAIASEVREIARQVAVKGVGTDEFRRVLDPTLTYIKDIRQTNDYWLHNVLTGADRYPQQLDWSRSFVEDYASITARDVIELAHRYLDDHRAATVIVSPLP